MYVIIYRIITLIFLYIVLFSGSFAQSIHGDKTKLPKGCGSCHVGHGKRDSAMLPEYEENLCYQCHGDNKEVEKSKNEKKILSQGVNLGDVKAEFSKPYHHPVEITGIHEPRETLPETDPSKKRHSECVDCHDRHVIFKDYKYVREGKKKSTMRNITYEYELCYKCHSYSANLPFDQRNKEKEFDPANKSYHPIESPGKNRNVPSLLSPYNTLSIINCTDCHNPHGSSYEHILKRNYSTSDRIMESSFQYDLCYECHSRSSILNDESFSKHSLHIVDVKTSCITCHNSHGSEKYPYLIDFSSRKKGGANISPSSSGRIEFIDRGQFSGECYLTCHGKDHNPAVYPEEYQLKINR